MDIQEFRDTWATLPLSLRKDLANNCRAYITPDVRERNACYLTGAASAFAECGRISHAAEQYVIALVAHCAARESARAFVLNEWRAEQ